MNAACRVFEHLKSAPNRETKEAGRAQGKGSARALKLICKDVRTSFFIHYKHLVRRGENSRKFITKGAIPHVHSSCGYRH